MKSYWIWNYGDYEIFHTNMVNSRRQEQGIDYPPMWRLYDVDRNVVFLCNETLPEDGTIKLHLNGQGRLVVDGTMYGPGKSVPVKKGEHRFEIHVMNFKGLPAAYIESDVFATDARWYTLDEKADKRTVGFNEKYTYPQDNPETFRFSYQTIYPQKTEKMAGGVLYDFGKELFGFLHVDSVGQEDNIHVSYGESREEALDVDYTIIREDITGKTSYKLRQRAFRYIFLTGADTPSLWAELEYQKLENMASFRCDNEDINKIWDMCAYTLQLNMREVITEAVKRDRWLWGGDAYQAFKFIKYLCSDQDTVRRSLIGLRGKEPFCEHINRITDYTLFWVIGVLEYYQTYADLDFIRAIYPRAVSLMDFCAGREDEKGFIIGKYKDWVFIDWSDIDKTGAVCAEQMLYIAANRAMYDLSELVGADGDKYKKKAEKLLVDVEKYFWCEEKCAFIDSFQSGSQHVTRHANIFAIMYDIATETQRDSIVKNVLQNDDITKITTPYFEGYELDVMGKIGDVDYIYDMLISYWKGMLDLGATTVWEEYNPAVSGSAHYAMYGGRYLKSLCHAWGASPIYLLGRYFLGVVETEPGYSAFEVRPQLGKFKYIDGTVPVRDGKVSVYLSEKELCVTSTVSGGTLVWNGVNYILEKEKPVTISLSPSCH
ncbi:MAG: alpha-rhamnosidase [Clostridiales bacterium]|nr:alpha-rhamnosidase [Clostridiales bacterium]